MLLRNGRNLNLIQDHGISESNSSALRGSECSLGSDLAVKTTTGIYSDAEFASGGLVVFPLPHSSSTGPSI
jgi:hypothetical protein